MTIPYTEALAAIAASLVILMAGASVVQQRTGNSGWVDTVRSFSLGLVERRAMDIPDSGLPDGYSADGSANAALARRPLSRLRVADQSALSATAASMIRTSGCRFSEKIMLKMKGVVT